MQIGIGLLLLLFVVPQTHLLIAEDIQRPGSSFSAKDFPIPGVRSFMQAAIDKAGPFGLSAPLAQALEIAALFALGLQRA
ncbi:MAG: hypothetical protein AAF605_02215 [Myxococcota bacterium]